MEGGYGLTGSSSFSLSTTTLYGEAPVHEAPPGMMSCGLPGWHAVSPSSVWQLVLYCSVGCCTQPLW